MSDGVTVDASAPLTFGGDVRTVLESPRANMPPKTLEEARNQPGRREQIEAITKQIEAQGIKYVFFQQVSITGRIMGKGVVASFFPRSPNPATGSRSDSAHILVRVILSERLTEDGHEVVAGGVESHVVAQEVAARVRRLADVERHRSDACLVPHPARRTRAAGVAVDGEVVRQ